MRLGLGKRETIVGIETDRCNVKSDYASAIRDFAQNRDLAAITQAGGWKSTRMPLQYAEKINAARSGMARAAAVTGRDDSASDEGVGAL